MYVKSTIVYMSAEMKDSAAANHVFHIVNRAEKFNNHSIEIIVINEKVWFRGKDAATILEYTKTDKAIRDRVEEKYRKSLEQLILETPPPWRGPEFNQIQLRTIYISEAGLYSLILGSKLETAKKFKSWVVEELIPSVRKNGSYVSPDITADQVQKLMEELKEKERLIEEQAAELNEAKRLSNNLNTINAELLRYKKFKEKGESIYIASTPHYASQGLFKVGRSANLKVRKTSHNTTHPTGDKIEILAEFKVSDCAESEKHILKMLDPLRPDSQNEFIMCPFDMLRLIIEHFVERSNEDVAEANILIDTVYKLRSVDPKSIDWTTGISPEFFDQKYKITGPDGGTVAEFNAANATVEERIEFLKSCVSTIYDSSGLSYDSEFTVVWPEFCDKMLIKASNIPTRKFKRNEWFIIMEEVAKAFPGLRIVKRKLRV